MQIQRDLSYGTATQELSRTPTNTSANIEHKTVSVKKSIGVKSELVHPQLPLSRDNNVEEKSTIEPRLPPPQQHHVPSFAFKPLCPPSQATSSNQSISTTSAGRPQPGSLPWIDTSGNKSKAALYTPLIQNNKKHYPPTQDERGHYPPMQDYKGYGSSYYTGKDTSPLSSTGHYPPMQNYKDTAPTSTGYSPISSSINDFMPIQHTSSMQDITDPTPPLTAPISVTNKGHFPGIQDLMQTAPKPISDNEHILQTSFPIFRHSQIYPKKRSNIRLTDKSQPEFLEIIIPLTMNPSISVDLHSNQEIIAAQLGFATKTTKKITTQLGFTTNLVLEWNVSSPTFGIPSNHKCNQYLREDLPNHKLPLYLQVILGTHGFIAILGQLIKGKHHGIAYTSRNLEQNEEIHPRITQPDIIEKWTRKHFKNYLDHFRFQYQVNQNFLLTDTTNTDYYTISKNLASFSLF
jgi:hypothetical protein